MMECLYCKNEISKRKLIPTPNGNLTCPYCRHVYEEIDGEIVELNYYPGKVV